MRQMESLATVTVVAWLVLATPGLRAEVTALRVIHKDFDPDGRELTYQLRNDSEKTITAWRLSLARGDVHGHSQKSTLDQDFYMNLSRPPRSAGADVDELGDRGPIRPGGVFAASWRLGGARNDSQPRALSLKVMAVVFEDLSREGDPDVGRILLQARQKRVNELGRVLELVGRQGRQSLPREAQAASLRQHAQKLRRMSSSSEDKKVKEPELAAQLSATRMELAERLEAAAREVEVAAMPGLEIQLLATALDEEYRLGRDQTRALPADANDKEAD